MTGNGWLEGAKKGTSPVLEESVAPSMSIFPRSTVRRRVPFRSSVCCGECAECGVWEGIDRCQLSCRSPQASDGEPDDTSSGFIAMSKPLTSVMSPVIAPLASSV